MTAGNPVLVHCVVALDEPHEAFEVLGTLALSYERGGSMLVNPPAVIWKIGAKFKERLKSLLAPRQPAERGERGAASPPSEGNLSGRTGQYGYDPLAQSSLKLPLFTFVCKRRGAMGRAEETEYQVLLTVLFPRSFPDYRVGMASLAAEFETMAKDGSRPRKRIVIGVTNHRLRVDKQPDDDPFGTGIDQLISPLALEALGERLGAAPAVSVAVTGWEKVFADFVRLRRERPDEALLRLPWRRHDTASSAARDPEIMVPLMQFALAKRPHLATMSRVHRDFASGPRTPLAFLPVMPSGFLSPWGSANYRPETGDWQVGDRERLIQDEMEYPAIVPFASCDVLLSAVLDEPSKLQVTRVFTPGDVAGRKRWSSRAARRA